MNSIDMEAAHGASLKLGVATSSLLDEVRSLLLRIDLGRVIMIGGEMDLVALRGLVAACDRSHDEMAVIMFGQSKEVRS